VDLRKTRTQRPAEQTEKKNAKGLKNVRGSLKRTGRRGVSGEDLSRSNEKPSTLTIIEVKKRNKAETNHIKSGEWSEIRGNDKKDKRKKEKS